MKRIFFFLFDVFLLYSCSNRSADEPWSVERAWKWYKKSPWLVGFNFVPSTACNTTEMWSKDTFDPETIERELGMAFGLGFNSCRVFLQYIVWKDDPEGFIKRFDEFLDIARKNNISVMPVFFDDCCFGTPQQFDPYLGKQREPQPGLGNSSWTPSPGQEARARLMTFRVGRMGQFQEWVEDIDDPNCQHRHLSHLLALQPCRQVNPRENPELIEAAKVTLIQRRDNDFVTLHRPDLGNSVLFPTKSRHEGLPYDYYTSQAWSRVARLCTWLRVCDGDNADKIQNDILRESTLENMIQYESRAHYGDKPVPDVPFFIKTTVLGAGYVTEMVLQSQYGELELLPALPSSWATGKIKGIRARGACTVDIEWKDGKLVSASITPDNGGEYTIRYKDKTRTMKINKGDTCILSNTFWSNPMKNHDRFPRTGSQSIANHQR